MAKSKLRIKSRILRQQGLGIKTIALQLHVSSSTVSLWCRDIQLTQEQIHELEHRSRDPQYGRRLAYSQKQKNARLKKIGVLMQQGVNETKVLSKDNLFFSGVSLYWAEGFKKDNLVGFANSDPAMIIFFIKWLAICCHIPKSRLKVRIGLNEQYADKIEEMENYWSKTVHIPKNQFQKAFIQKVQWKKIYDNPQDYHGLLRIRVSKSTDLLRRIHGWIEGLKR